MKKRNFIQKICAYFILSALIVTFLPWGLLHTHENQCHKIHKASETEDLCHITELHPEQKRHCAHRTHLSSVKPLCHVCKIHVTPIYGALFLPDFILSTLVASQNATIKTYIAANPLSLFQNKSPPHTFSVCA